MPTQVVAAVDRKGVTVLSFTSNRGIAPLEVDYLDSAEVESRLESTLKQGLYRILVDLRNVAYLHSRAFWSLVRSSVAARRRDGKLVLVGPSPYVKHMIENTSALDAVDVSRTLSDGWAMVLGKKGQRAAGQAVDADRGLIRLHQPRAGQAEAPYRGVPAQRSGSLDPGWR